MKLNQRLGISDEVIELIQSITEKKKLDKADPKEAGKDFDDRKDKDIDNDGDVDKSDKYLHNRRKAVSKAMKKGGAKDQVDTEPEMKDVVSESELANTRRADVGVEKTRTPDGRTIFKKKPRKEINVEERKLDEISPKLARKAAATSQAKSFDHSSSAYGPDADKESDRLQKKADKAMAHVQKRQGDKGVKKVDRLSNKAIFGRSRAFESVEEVEIFEQDVPTGIKIHHTDAKGNKTHTIVFTAKDAQRHHNEVKRAGGKVTGHQLMYGKKEGPMKKVSEATGVADQAVDKHNCATHVYHEQYGEGQTIYSMHADPDEQGLIEWYDVMFEHGIERRVPTAEMKVTREMSHGNHKKKK